MPTLAPTKPDRAIKSQQRGWEAHARSQSIANPVPSLGRRDAIAWQRAAAGHYRSARELMGIVD
jgi:hypothetical protein